MTTNPSVSGSYVLGLDLGVASIGWALLQIDEAGSPIGLAGTGAHLFEPGVGVGQRSDESPAKARRDARSIRRQTWRRKYRRQKTAKVLQRYGLLPDGPLASSFDVDVFFKQLDFDLTERWEKIVPRQRGDRLMYQIRSAAVKGKVELDELGRALYHIAHRRGFLSNRRTERKDDDDKGVVKTAIGELEKLIEESGEPTLGAYLANVNPHEQRIRNRYTHRSMYEREFDLIWEEQSKHHGCLTDGAKEDIHHAIFYQRPLKDQSHLIGVCSLITDRKPAPKRAPKALRAYQRFRLLQGVNHLTIDQEGKAARKLDAAERETLIDALSYTGDLAYSKLRTKKLLGLPKTTEFDFVERADQDNDKKLIGHRTDAKLRKVFGDRFDDFSDHEKDEIVHDLRSIRETDALIRRGINHWGLPREDAEQLADIRLEEGHASLSVDAIERLLPHLESGMSYSEARKVEFPESFTATQSIDVLPPVCAVVENLTNPSVHRALSELRRVVNAIVRTHGKPERIHIELARELKHGKTRRERTEKRIKDREKQRSFVAQHIIQKTIEGGFPIEAPRREDIEKVLLADECGWICPYTGREICWETLLGPHPQFDIEHIWPFSRSLDNSFLNKTLCYAQENRAVKRRQTPFEAYSLESDQWEAMLLRVKRFKGDSYVKREKLRRFQAEVIDDGFSERHLRETSYIAREATDYLALLYGGQIDASGKRRIQSSTGGATFWTRRELALNSILGDTGEKNRADHRHHAVDAVVVAFLTPGAIQQLSRASVQAEEEGSRRLFLSIKDPWDNFRADVIDSINSINISHRQTRKVSGALHKESLYSKPIHGGRRIRKNLTSLSVAEIKSDTAIVDPRARALIRERLAEFVGPEFKKTDISKVFTDPTNLPIVPGPDGKPVPIRHVRIAVNDNPMTFGSGATERYANTGNNHHCTMHHRQNPKNGKIEWKYSICTVAEAYERMRYKKPVAQRDIGDGWVFDFSLVKNEFVEMEDDASERHLYRLLSISQKQTGGPDNTFALHTDALPDRSLKVRISSMKAFWKRNPRKVFVSYLGVIYDAGG